MNDGFSSNRLGLLAWAVHDPDRGIWETYQSGLMTVLVKTDLNHRVYISTDDPIKTDITQDITVTVDSKYPEINWAFQVNKDDFLGIFVNSLDFWTAENPFLCYFGGQDSFYRPMTDWDESPVYPADQSDSFGTNGANMTADKLEYLTLNTNSFNYPLDLDYYIDITNADDTKGISDEEDFIARRESYWTCRENLT